MLTPSDFADLKEHVSHFSGENLRHYNLRAACFAEKHGLTIAGGLGADFDGSVFVTSRHSAIKVFRFDLNG